MPDVPLVLAALGRRTSPLLSEIRVGGLVNVHATLCVCQPPLPMHHDIWTPSDGRRCAQRFANDAKGFEDFAAWVGKSDAVVWAALQSINAGR